MSKLDLKLYFSFIKFSHTVFALPFAIVGYFIAVKEQNYFEVSTFLLVILAMVFARSAAMSFNRFLDREYDKLNPRTSKREIPSGKLSAKSAMLFTIFNSALFIIVTYLINSLVFYLSPLALFIVLFYSYTKRFTSLSHFVLGIGLGLAPLGAFLCVIQRFDILPILLSLFVLTWVSGFDIVYALQDEDFDKKIGLKSIPVLLGKTRSIILSIILHLLSSFFLIYIGVLKSYGVWYWTGAIIFIFFLIYQHLIIGKGDLSKINLAFFTVNGISSVLFMAFYLLELWLE